MLVNGIYAGYVSRIHAQNVEKGWWDTPRTFTQQCLLFLSESSEGFEGVRKHNMPDDKLPQYSNLHVELADLWIRCADHLGYIKYDFEGAANLQLSEVAPLLDGDDIFDNLMMINYVLVQAWSYSKDLCSDYRVNKRIKQVMLMCHYIVTRDGINFFEIVDAKLEYNKVRPDHTREARAQPGGKAL